MINNDKEIMENRKELLKFDTDKAPLRDQIVKDLFKEIKKRNLGLNIVDMWQQISGDRQEWLDNQQEFLADWDQFTNVSTQGVFENSSNLHMPVTLTQVRAYHARFMQATVSPEPLISVKARKASHTDLAADVEEFIKYTLSQWCNYRGGIEETLDQWIWSWLTSGIGYIKWGWDVKFKKFKDVEEKQVQHAPRFIDDPATGNEMELPSIEIIEEEVTKVKKTYEGPVCSFLNFEDVAIVSQDLTDVANADAVIHRQYLTASELWTLVERGIFDNDAVEKIIEGGNDDVSSGIDSSIKIDRQSLSGEATLDKEYDLDRYEILEAYLSIDTDGTGINSDIIVWAHAKTGTELRATYLDRMNKSGERPIFPILFHKRSGTNKHLPVGLVEMLYPLSKEIDAMHNMRVDFGLISTVPFGFYRASSSLDPKEMRLEPGTLYPLDNPQTDVHFPQLGNRIAFGFQEEQALNIMVERLTSISDLTFGIMSGKQGATRTATGARALQQEMSTNLDIFLKRFNRGWKRALEYLLHMLQQRTPKGFEFRVTGSNGIDEYKKIMDPKDIAGDFDVEISPSTATSNKQIQMDNAMQILQLTQNPLDIQLGIVTPANRYEAIKNYLKTLGIKDVSRYISASLEGQILLTPEEEMERVTQGFEVPVVPNADHEGFMALAQQYMTTPGMITSDQILLIQGQVSKHQQMMQMMEQLQAQQRNVNQVATNQNLSLPDMGNINV